MIRFSIEIAPNGDFANQPITTANLLLGRCLGHNAVLRFLRMEILQTVKVAWNGPVKQFGTATMMHSLTAHQYMSLTCKYKYFVGISNKKDLFNYQIHSP